MNSPIFILGMHRSGTSCMAGHLQQAGLYLGEVKERSRHNGKGNRENSEIRILNQSVLESNGYDWHAPPGMDGAFAPLIWSDAQSAIQAQKIREFASHSSLWGNKDPRMLLTLDGWRAALPEARFVASIRHPLAVVASLQTRHAQQLDRFSQAHCLALWRVYNARLLKLATEERVPIICFDWPQDRYSAQITRIAHFLGLTQDLDKLSFYDTELRHHIRDHDDVPRDIAQLWSELLQIAEFWEKELS